MPNSHDRFFKEALTRGETAQDLARHYLPMQVVEQLDLDSMEVVKDSWVDPELQEHFADVLYQLKWRDPGITSSVYLFLLFEHKSQPEKALRCSCCNTWRNSLTELRDWIVTRLDAAASQ